MFARTERLLLRPGWIEDAPALAQAISHEAVVRNLGPARWPTTADDAERWLRHAHDPLLPNLLVLSRTEDAPELVGGAGLHRLPGGGIELDFWISPHHRCRGFATEAGRAMLNMAQAIGLSRLAACVFSDDSAASRVLEKLGFTRNEVTMRHSAKRNSLIPATKYCRELDIKSHGLAPSLAA